MNVPTISQFFGIAIRMYFGEHAPPHFHAIYSGDDCSISIDTLDVIRGRIPRRALGMVVEWAMQHREELRENWRRVEAQEPLQDITPLE